MTKAVLEHINITVQDAPVLAERLCELFDWRIRWSGTGIHGGQSVHVGGKDSYLALYTQIPSATGIRTNYSQPNTLNHIGVVVADLETTEVRIVKAGYKPYSHANYEPGQRFYFRYDDNIEFEVISYGPHSEATSP